MRVGGRSGESEGAMRVRRLGIARIMCLAPCLGLSLACVILLAIGTAKLFVGDLGLLRMLPMLIVNAGIVVGLSRIVVPAIDRRLLQEARGEESPDLALPLLEIETGFPLGSLRTPLGVETARVLDSLDEEWWGRHGQEMRKQAAKVLTTLENPSSWTPVDAAWVKPLLHAMARAGRTEFLPRLERLEKRAAKLSISPDLLDALSACVVSLRRRALREHEAATLLRCSQGGDKNLLRPTSSVETAAPETLLRPDSQHESQDSANHYAQVEQPAGEAAQGATAS